MKIYLLRHGETGINAIGGRFQGQIDTPGAALTEKGRRQAREAGEKFRRMGLHFDLVYTSPRTARWRPRCLLRVFPPTD
jgi:broad specificity phosphatase PhoE